MNSYIHLTAILACLGTLSHAGQHKVCKDKPADIVFVIDESTSIWPVHFIQLRNFIADLTTRFTVNPNATRFAALTFSDRVTPRFKFDEYKSSKDVKKAVLNVDQKKGGTQTHLALQHVRHRIVPTMREGVPKIAIVITDGASWYPQKTEKEAALLQKKNVTTFVIAVSSQIRYSEIEAMASDPDEQHVFSVKSYDDLSDTLIKQLVSSACSIRDTPGVCNIKQQTDVVFVAASISQNPIGAIGAMELAESVISDANTYVGRESIQFGLVPSTCQLDIGFDLDRYHNKQAMMAHMQRAKDSLMMNPADHLNYMTENSFLKRNGGRRDVKKVAVVIMDRSSPEYQQTILAAEKAKAAGIEIIAVAIGKQVDDAEISAIASEPQNTHKITLSDYTEIENFKQKLYPIICP